MANKRVGDSNAGQRTIPLTKEDWTECLRLVGVFDLNGVGALVRLFLRLVQNNPALIMPLLEEARKNNKQVQAPSIKDKDFKLEGS